METIIRQQWRPCSEKPPAELQSTAIDTVPLLLSIPGYLYAKEGRYLASIDEWYMRDSPSRQPATHWMPMPKNATLTEGES